MIKIKENTIFKHDLPSIDMFICQYGNQGILHPNLSVKKTLFDTNEEIEILEDEFDINNHFHTYFINYDEILPFFDFGLFCNEIEKIFSEISQNFRAKLDDYLTSLNDINTKKIKIYEIKLHFMSIDKILLKIKSNKILKTNPIQNCVIDFFREQYNNEIEYLNDLYLEYSNNFSETNAEALKNIIKEIVSQKLENFAGRIGSIEENLTTELLSREEAITYLNTSPSSLWRWENRGYIKSYMIGGKKLYKKDELNESLSRVS